eukprot:403673-Amphidinium_carterae.1
MGDTPSTLPVKPALRYSLMLALPVQEVPLTLVPLSQWWDRMRRTTAVLGRTWLGHAISDPGRQFSCSADRSTRHPAMEDQTLVNQRAEFTSMRCVDQGSFQSSVAQAPWAVHDPRSSVQQS